MSKLEHGDEVWYQWPPSLQYKTHKIPTPKCVSSRLAVAFAQSTEPRRKVEYEDVVGAARTGDAPTTSEWPAILLPTKVSLMLEVWRYAFDTVCTLFILQILDSMKSDHTHRSFNGPGYR